jgi:hypothetical protein
MPEFRHPIVSHNHLCANDDKTVVGANHSSHNDREGSFAVEEDRSRISRVLDINVLAIYCSNAFWKIPSSFEFAGNKQSVL